ncbi:beta-galactosidase [Clostridiales bacterium COT073_COT-073]|nr:beta-galactosidase [Clostridiales bacterium COT073_COT-073]
MSRLNHNLNSNWNFIKTAGNLQDILLLKGEPVNLPHTWNNLDGQDGGGDYIRNAFWYTRELSLSKSENKKYFLELEAASLIADIYINQNHVFRHQGGFSTFRVDITSYLENGLNLIAIQVDNRENEITYPQAADFTFFGGIYRSVSLIETNTTHFDLEYYGSSGVTITPILHEDGTANIQCNAYIKGTQAKTIRYEILDHQGNTILYKECPATCPQAELALDQPHLWQGMTDPYLYQAVVSLSSDDTLLDQVSVHFGIRRYHVDPEKGFFLNGKSYPLHGVSRHQDRQDMGWAITEKEHIEDMELIKEVGANTIRLAHYQHNKFFYDLCDKYGMIVWAEIPFISVFMDTKEAHDDTISQMTELVVQNYHHPSICFWGIANEITIGGDDNPHLLENLKELHALAKHLDPTRLTTIANVSMLEMDSLHNQVTDILAYNHYFGWYFGDVSQNASWFDQFHQLHPDRCLGLSEYGAEGILKWHTDDPKVQDYTEEYHAWYHENMLKTFASRPYLWGTYVWNMFDFAADNRDEGGVKGRNNKGLVTYDRSTKKDAFFVYQAYWCPEPMLHLCSKRYLDRAGETTNIKVYSNLPTVSLTVNGQKFAELTGEKVFVFQNVPLQMGENTITAVAGELNDTMVIRRVTEPNPDYILPNSDAGSNVTNWFESPECANLEHPEGYYSIKDKVKDIMAHPQGAELIDQILNKSSGSAAINPNMMKMLANMPLEQILQFARKHFDGPAVLALNQALNKIKK